MAALSPTPAPVPASAPAGPGRRGSRGRRGRRPVAALVAASVLGCLVAATVAQGDPAAAAAAKPNPAGATAFASTARAQQQCDLGVTAAHSDDATKARQIMSGRVAIEKYGTVVLAADPTWKPQSGLDSSGDGHMNSLHYLMPLLREGTRTHDTAMINRFYWLIWDWGRDNKIGAKKPPNRYGWQPIYTGYRMQVIGCALAGPRGREAWLRKLAAVHANFVSTYTSSLASNNTGIQLAMGQYVIGCSMGIPSWRTAALGRLGRLAGTLVYSDGSTREGAISYAVSDYAWFRLAAQRVALCGQRAPSSLARVSKVPGFVAQAIRPDGRYEALGDTSPVPASVSTLAGTVAEWPARLGAGGAHPAATFAYYRAAGYVFGRSGWGTATRPFGDQTFYSIRMGAGPGAGIFHAHADAGSLTLFADGSQQLFDTGQWKYQYGATRNYVTGRDAHNVVTASGGGYSTSNLPPVWRVSSNSDRDLVTLVDNGYRKNKITMVRTVVYSRHGEYLVVWDRAVSSLRTAKGARVPRTFAQHWQLGPGRTVSLGRGTASTNGPGANTTMIWLGAQPALGVRTGSRTPMQGWVSPSYGTLTAAPTVRAVRGNTVDASWVTVIASRPAGLPASAVHASAHSVQPGRVDLSVTTAKGLTERVVLTRQSATVSR